MSATAFATVARHHWQLVRSGVALEISSVAAASRCAASDAERGVWHYGFSLAAGAASTLVVELNTAFSVVGARKGSSAPNNSLEYAVDPPPRYAGVRWAPFDPDVRFRTLASITSR